MKYNPALFFNNNHFSPKTGKINSFLKSYPVSLSGLLDIVGGDDDGGGCGAGYLDEVSPDGLSQQGIHPHCGLVQNEKLRLLEQSNREAGSPGNI